MATQMVVAVAMLKLKMWGLFATIGLQCALQSNGRKQAPHLQLQHCHRHHHLSSHPREANQLRTPSKQEKAKEIKQQPDAWKKRSVEQQTELSKSGAAD